MLEEEGRRPCDLDLDRDRNWEDDFMVVAVVAVLRII